MRKTAYTVAPDVAWVNGAEVHDDRTVHLTDTEAAFDLGLGRIALASAASVEVQSAEAASDPAGDPGD